MKRSAGVIILILLLLLPLFSFPGKAGETLRLGDLAALPEGPALQSGYAVLMEAKSGAILFEKNATEKAYPASITKIMTAILTMENCSLNDQLTFSYRATHELEPGSSSIARTEGEVMTVEECLYALMVASANEVAQGLAEHISGSLEAFVDLMNRKAQDLGCVNTHFANTHGYHNPEHYSCAYDIALILKEALRHETLVEIMGTPAYQIPPTNKHSEITYLRSYHPLIIPGSSIKYPYAVAGKTGYTDEALCTLATYAKKDDLDLVCVCMQSESQEVNGRDTISLFEYGFRWFTCYNLSKLDSMWNEGETPFLGKDLVRFTNAEPLYCTLPNQISVTELKSQTIFHGNQGGEGLATRIYTYQDQEVARSNLKWIPTTSNIELTPVVQLVPSRNEVLREKHLGLPLIYWILIGGGLGLLLLTWFTVWIAIRSVKRFQRKRAQAKRAMDRMTDDRFPPLI